MSKEKDLKIMIEMLSHEKDISKDIVFEAVEEALAVAHQKHLGDFESQIEVSIDQRTGKMTTSRIWDVIADNEEKTIPSLELHLSEAKKFASDAAVGKKVREPIESLELGRIGAQIAKQGVVQRLRQAKKEHLAKLYEEKTGELVTGTVKKTTREFLILDLPHNAEGILPRRHMLPREVFRINDAVRCVVDHIDWDKKGPTILLSRTSGMMLTQLFAIEVPEIGEGSIEIRAVARDPGSRAKVAVQAKDLRIEPKGACIGIRGSRVNSVMEELGGERIDVILWDDNDAQFVVNALAPAEVKSIVVDEAEKTMQIIVEQATLSQAIGKNGQNVRLASELTGWKIVVVSEEQAEDLQKEELSHIKELFCEKIGLDEQLADVLIEAGFTQAHELAYVDQQDFYELGFDDDLINYFREKSQEYLLNQAAAPTITNELSTVPGLNPEWVNLLVEANIQTTEDLADLSIADLMDILPCSSEEAGALIMAARSLWFD